MRTALEIVIAVGLVGCGGGTTAPASPLVATPARVPFVQADEGPAVAARLSARSGASWIDVRVAGNDAASLHACDVIAERERSLRDGSPDPAQVARACAPEVPPPVELDVGAHVLVYERQLGAGERALLELGEVQATVTELHAFAGAEACVQLRQRLHEANARARAEAEESARAWLEEQRARSEERVTRICGEAEAVAQRCAGLRERTMERNVCDLDRERSERECAGERALTERLAERETEPAEDAGPEPRCVPVDG